MNSLFSAPSCNAPLTSVLTSSYNSALHLNRAIESVLKSRSTDFEYLIIDDGSTDNTQEIIQTIAHYPRIRIFWNKSRKGITWCRNYLTQKSRGKYLSILDADDQMHPNKIERHSQILEADPDIGVVWGQALIYDPTLHSWGVLPEPGFQYEWDIVSSYQVVHSATTWRKEAILRAGSYSEKLSARGEEAVDMFFRVGDSHRQHYDPSFVATKRINRSLWKARALHNRQFSKSLLAQTILRRYGITGRELKELTY